MSNSMNVDNERTQYDRLYDELGPSCFFYVVDHLDWTFQKRVAQSELAGPIKGTHSPSRESKVGNCTPRSVLVFLFF